jgi:hypothetical protein
VTRAFEDLSPMTSVRPAPRPSRSASARVGLAAVVVAALGLVAAPARALTFGLTGDAPLETLPVAAKRLSLHPFTAAPPARSSALGLYDGGALDFAEAARRAVAAELASPWLKVVSRPMRRGAGLAGAGDGVELSFSANGIPVCDLGVRAFALVTGGTYVAGNVPTLDAQAAPTAADFPDANLAREKALEAVAALSGAQALRVDAATPCLRATSDQLVPVYDVRVVADGLPYRALADAYEALTVRPLFFSVDGKARAFDQNRNEVEPKDVTLTDLKDGGTLTSTYLKTNLPGGYTAAVEPTETFNYPPTDPKFEEVQAYYHAQVHLAFFKALGFEWYGPSPLELKIHQRPNNRPNNALFVPGNEATGTLPSITIDDGDGIDLQNLVTDGDVVSHEFGHHVIFRTLKLTDGESLVLHEGLADFFTFSRTGDACLGESICPKGSGACILEAQCLRTGDNKLTYGDAAWTAWLGAQKKLGHLHGQLVSGMLWELRKTGTIPAADLTTTVFKALGYLLQDSGLRDFVLALLLADREFMGGKNQAAILAQAQARGLGPFLTDVTVDAPLPALAGRGADSPELGAPKKKHKGDDNLLKCGTIASPPGGAASRAPELALALLVGLVPFAAAALGARRRARLAPVPARAQRQRS